MSEKKEYGIWDAIQTFFILYFLFLGIKMIYVETPKSIYRYLFDPVDVHDEVGPWKLLTGMILFYVAAVAIFFVFSLAGLAAIAAVALIFSWAAVFLYEFSLRVRVGFLPGKTRFWIFLVFATKCSIFFVVSVALAFLYIVRAKLHEIAPSEAGIAIDGGIVLLVASIIFSVYAIRRNINKKRQSRLDEKEREMQLQKIEELQKTVANFSFLLDYLKDVSGYYDPEKKKYARWLKEENQIENFCLHWDDAERLFWMGEIIGRHSICHLSRMTEQQEIARREAAWNRKKAEQSQHQRRINEEKKAERLAANPPGVASEAQLISRELAKQEKLRIAQEKLRIVKEEKMQRDAQYQKELKAKGKAARAAYKNPQLKVDENSF